MGLSIRHMQRRGGRSRRKANEKYGVAYQENDALVVFYRTEVEGKGTNAYSLKETLLQQSVDVDNEPWLATQRLLVLASAHADQLEGVSVSEIVDNLTLYDVGAKSFDVVVVDRGADTQDYAKIVMEFVDQAAVDL